MGTTDEEIRTWLVNAKEGGATHVIIVCDTFDHEDYPVPVLADESVDDVYLENNDPDKMKRVMEVYALHVDFEAQLDEHRAWHFEGPGEPPRTECKRKKVEPAGIVAPPTRGENPVPSPPRRSTGTQTEGTAGRVRPIQQQQQPEGVVDQVIGERGSLVVYAEDGQPLSYYSYRYGRDFLLAVVRRRKRGTVEFVKLEHMDALRALQPNPDEAGKVRPIHPMVDVAYEERLHCTLALCLALLAGYEREDVIGVLTKFNAGRLTDKEIVDYVKRLRAAAELDPKSFDEEDMGRL